jgi:uncharacterized RDD family membrane protein YckC
VSTLHTASLFPSWKQEVNRKVADHLSRKSGAAEEPTLPRETRTAPTGRAARAAARVAARYANAPSYSEMLAEEARAAMRAAEAAQQAADDAHAAVQMVLAGLGTAATAPAHERETPQRSGFTSSNAVAPRDELTVVAVEDFPPADSARADSLTAAATSLQPQREDQPTLEEAAALGWPDALPTHFAGELEPGHLAEPVHANIIEFPREVVATRRLRPRRIEGPLAELESAPQLSIFEVDPAAVSTQPSAPAVEEPTTPEWMRPGWPPAELEAQAEPQVVEDSAPQQAGASAIVDLAPLSRRVMSNMVDVSLTLATFLLVVLLTAKVGVLHNAHTAAFAAVFLLLAVAAGYQALCSNYFKATPGMAYAGIGLCTVDGYVPDRAQRGTRLIALIISVLPLGLGLAWSLFDEDRLTWHDRLSGTYLRMR